MVSSLINQLSTIVPLSSSCEKALTALAKQREISKGEYIHHAGEVCRRLYFIEKGLFRFYYYDSEGKDITFQFFDEGQFTSVINSYYSQEPSLYNIEALEDSVIFSLNFKDFEHLLDKFPELVKIYNYVLRQFLISTEHRIAALQFYNAEERYQDFVRKYPSIIQRVPLGHVATYLGINQATLSRVRSKIRL